MIPVLQNHVRGTRGVCFAPGRIGILAWMWFALPERVMTVFLWGPPFFVFYVFRGMGRVGGRCHVSVPERSVKVREYWRNDWLNQVVGNFAYMMKSSELEHFWFVETHILRFNRQQSGIACFWNFFPPKICSSNNSYNFKTSLYFFVKLSEFHSHGNGIGCALLINY